MARPQRSRSVCCEPEFTAFTPDIKACGEVTLTVDEYHVIRLVDLEQMTHAEAARRMDISRPTTTEIYNCARNKIADCLINGKQLRVAGGNYRLCDGKLCGDGCRRRKAAE